ncbi:uncharacterized protein LOC143607015 [Bidens hawaiensis]|uniref:uncharacterized protein LOC143607015 n=1 Tax=Bidens hawaiensis TaxID=980011 RepID=UPI00404B724D
MEKALQRYGVAHQLATAYHPLTSGQVEVTYKTPIGSTPFRIIYGKAFHLPVELEHRVSWALLRVNLDLSAAEGTRFHQLHELEELWDHAYAQPFKYKERTNELHDRKMKGNKQLKCGDKSTKFKVNGHRLKHYIGEPVADQTIKVFYIDSFTET